MTTRSRAVPAGFYVDIDILDYEFSLVFMKRITGVVYVFEYIVLREQIHHLSSAHFFFIFILFYAIGQKITFVGHMRNILPEP